MSDNVTGNVPPGKAAKMYKCTVCGERKPGTHFEWYKHKRKSKKYAHFYHKKNCVECEWRNHYLTVSRGDEYWPEGRYIPPWTMREMLADGWWEVGQKFIHKEKTFVVVQNGNGQKLQVAT